MFNASRLALFVTMVLLTACGKLANYDDNDVAAIVKGETITVGDLRFLYSDKTALDYLDWLITVELIKHEIEEKGIEVREDLMSRDEWFKEIPPKNTKDEGGKQIRKHAESQAKKLNMTPEVYQKEYAERIKRHNAILLTYLEEKLGQVDIKNEADVLQSIEKVDELLEEIKQENETEIEVFIK